VSETVSDGISITVTVVSLALATYSVLAFGLISISKGLCPVGSVAMTVCVAVLIANSLRSLSNKNSRDQLLTIPESLRKL